MSDFSPDQLQQYRQALLARQDELNAARDRAADERKPVQLDQSAVGRLSRMEAIQAQAMSLEADRRRQAELSRTARAIERLSRDEYGECLSCGEPVEDKRLANDPSTSLCLSCARGREAQR